MEYAPHGDFFDFISKNGQSFDDKLIRTFFRQLIDGIEYLHKASVAHLDLKPENLLLDYNKNIKIVDFGLSNTYNENELLKTACGSPCYAAPEMIGGKKYNGLQVDIWSCGVILFAIVCGYLPFEDPNTAVLYKKILSGDYTIPSFVSEEAKDLISKLLKTDVAERYSAEEALDHPWLRGETASDKPIPVSVLNSLKAFNNRNKFKQRILHAMTNTLTDDQIELLKTAFKTLDKNGDGTITANEMRDAFGELSNEEVQQIVSNADIDGDGTISYEELMIAAVQRKIMSKEERLLAVFRSIDKNGDGHITVDELKEALGDDNAAKLIAEVDSNGDGVVDYEEFLIAWGDSLTPEAPKLPNMPSEEL